MIFVEQKLQFLKQNRSPISPNRATILLKHKYQSLSQTQHIYLNRIPFIQL